jgi:hypothetical protein
MDFSPCGTSPAGRGNALVRPESEGEMPLEEVKSGHSVRAEHNGYWNFEAAQDNLDA